MAKKAEKEKAETAMANGAKAGAPAPDPPPAPAGSGQAAPGGARGPERRVAVDGEGTRPGRRRGRLHPPGAGAQPGRLHGRRRHASWLREWATREPRHAPAGPADPKPRGARARLRGM